MSSTNSSLVTHTVLSENRSSPRTGDISKITIHHTTGTGSALDTMGWLKPRSTAASYNYVVDNHGRYGLCVNERDRCWGSSSSANDNVAVVIGVMNSARTSDWPVGSTAYENMIRLCVDICSRNPNIKQTNGQRGLSYTGNSGGSLTRHDMFSNKICPGPFLKSRFTAICTEVNRRLAGHTPIPGIPPATDDGTSENSGGSRGRPTPADPPVIIRRGKFTLHIEYGKSTAFQRKFDIPCSSEMIPYIVLPTNFSIGDKRGSDFLGYCALLVNTETNNAQACIIGDVKGTGAPYLASLRAAWGIGAEPDYASKIETPNMVGEFIISIFNDFVPEWSPDSRLIDQIEAECSRRLGAVLLELNNNARAMALSNNTMNPDNIDHTMIDKYILAFDRNTTNTFDMTKAQVNGITSMMIEAGSITGYDGRNPTSFQNPKLLNQLKLARDNELQYALYIDANAKNIVEAQRDINLLSYVTNKNPPKLGIWLRINLTQSKRVNNDILDEYYRQLVKLGFIGNVGLYCAKNQLDKIDWEEKYSKIFWWCMIRRIGNKEELDTLLHPEFFMFDEDKRNLEGATAGSGSLVEGVEGFLTNGIPGMKKGNT
jgi:hypothetical protein